MPSQRNIQLLQEIKGKVGRASAMFFVDYQGLTHKQLEEVRANLRDLASEIAVAKNTLLNIALKEKHIDAQEKLQGPCATLFAYEDPIKVAKALSAFLKKYNLPASPGSGQGGSASPTGGPKIKFGIFEGEIVGENTILELAALPSKEVLLGKLVGLLKSPMNKFVYSLNYNASKLVFVLRAVEDKKKMVSV